MINKYKIVDNNFIVTSDNNESINLEIDNSDIGVFVLHLRKIDKILQDKYSKCDFLSFKRKKLFSFTIIFSLLTSLSMLINTTSFLSWLFLFLLSGGIVGCLILDDRIDREKVDIDFYLKRKQKILNDINNYLSKEKTMDIKESVNEIEEQVVNEIEKQVVNEIEEQVVQHNFNKESLLIEEKTKVLKKCKHN